MHFAETKFRSFNSTNLAATANTTQVASVPYSFTSCSLCSSQLQYTCIYKSEFVSTVIELAHKPGREGRECGMDGGVWGWSGVRSCVFGREGSGGRREGGASLPGRYRLALSRLALPFVLLSIK